MSAAVTVIIMSVPASVAAAVTLMTSVTTTTASNLIDAAEYQVYEHERAC